MLIELSSIEKPIITGKIKTINSQGKYTTLYLQDSSEQIIAFDKIEITENSTIEIYGQRQIKNNKTQIIANKIIKK